VNRNYFIATLDFLIYVILDVCTSAINTAVSAKKYVIAVLILFIARARMA